MSEKITKKWLKNLDKGFGVLGSLDELKERLPKMRNKTLLKELEEALLLHNYMDSSERLNYYMDISDTDKEARQRMEFDDEYIKLLDAEAERRGLNL